MHNVHTVHTCVWTTTLKAAMFYGVPVIFTKFCIYFYLGTHHVGGSENLEHIVLVEESCTDLCNNFIQWVTHVQYVYIVRTDNSYSLLPVIVTLYLVPLLM